jgi:hypothetical protein
MRVDEDIQEQLICGVCGAHSPWYTDFPAGRDELLEHYRSQHGVPAGDVRLAIVVHRRGERGYPTSPGLHSMQSLESMQRRLIRNQIVLQYGASV